MITETEHSNAAHGIKFWMRICFNDKAAPPANWMAGTVAPGR